MLMFSSFNSPFVVRVSDINFTMDKKSFLPYITQCTGHKTLAHAMKLMHGSAPGHFEIKGTEIISFFYDVDCLGNKSRASSVLCHVHIRKLRSKNKRS